MNSPMFDFQGNSGRSPDQARFFQAERSLFFTELLVGTAVAVAFFGVFGFIALARGEPRGDSSLSVEFRYRATDARMTSSELAKTGRDWPLLAGRKEARAGFAYVLAEIYNGEATPREIVLENGLVNGYTELLEPRPGGAVTLYRHGDSVPLGESPLRHHRAAFPLVIPPRVAVSYILEYRDPRGALVAPAARTWPDWHARASYERGLLTMYFGALFLLFLLNVFISSLGLGRFFLPFAALTVSTSVFYMGQTRFLCYLIDPFPVSRWLSSVAVAASLSSVMYLFRTVFEDRYARIERRVMLAIMMAVVPLTAASALGQGLFRAELAYLLMPVGFVTVGVAAVKAGRARAKEPVIVVIALLPWTLTLLIGDVMYALVGRMVFPREALSPLSFLFSIGLLTVSRQYLASHALTEASRELERSVGRAREETARALAGVAGLQSALSLRISRMIREPLDGIVARARILAREVHDERTEAFYRAVADDVRAICALTREGTAFAASGDRAGEDDVVVGGRGTDAGTAVFGARPEAAGEEVRAAGSGREGQGARVYLHVPERDVAARLWHILLAEGFAPVLATDRYHVLDDASAGKVDVLVIDASSSDDTAFSLCRLLRDSFSPVQLPMLLVADCLDDLAAERGRAAGFNDFLTRPFEAGALVLRVESLARLREASSRNESLARSESEKNAFLFFLTHNVNTPLTVLLNRVRELERVGAGFSSTQEFDDIQASAREINDIVQNVLVSFRLSDGRQTLWLESVDVTAALDRVFHEMSRKADAKDQRLEFSVPESVPSVMADRVALHGILYNLVDNAVKFAPRGGTVSVSVSANPVTVRVSDTGPGIRDEDRARLFGRFERLSARPTGGESSTGLGLHVARELAFMQGFELESPPGSSGGVFELVLRGRA